MASSNGALPTPSSHLWSITLYYLVTWYKRHEHCRRRTQYEHSRTGTGFVGVRRRRSRIGVSVTLVYCGSFASVHSHKPACPYRVSASSPTSLHCSSLQAPSCERVPTLDSSCRIDFVAVDWGCWGLTHLSADRIRSSRTCRLLPSRCDPTREDTRRPEADICTCGPCICGEPSASRSQWSETVQ